MFETDDTFQNKLVDDRNKRGLFNCIVNQLIGFFSKTWYFHDFFFKAELYSKAVPIFGDRFISCAAVLGSGGRIGEAIKERQSNSFVK